MDLAFFGVQLLNGLQYGLLLFLIASGLTLIFGIMGIINLAHGAMYMIGAYLVYDLTMRFGNFWLAILVAIPIAIALGLVIERLFLDTLYKRDHLYQVLLTFGLILVLNEAQRIIWGGDVHRVPVPAPFDASIQLTDNLQYSVYRLFVMGVCLVLAGVIYGVIRHTRLGIIIRAGAVNRDMVEGLGINVRTLFTLIFSVGVALTAFAGMIAAPLTSIAPGMGDSILITCFVVVVIGGIGSIKGAFWGAIIIGMATTFGAVLIPSLASMVIYLIMAAVLLVKPRGLFA
ncbi:MULTISPECIES: branched-chain amino acid ABC transporter permease [Halomonadaceae]|jgi:branched-chain amino acid transport system permease protein|uniref:Branched-chain amino acid ABC transporter permease n=1 Tax=Vreelandella piezotolerans TaxID=2609667 RepID=A0ABQ6X9I8_9GAMM|nr:MULTISPECIES: branched-chain amino acid ABC transporter permease [Halomonas]NGO90351.1 branched-chain amino acid ABC transporter permease [Halomonas sp.]KAE8438678.1 branched-chain amino acid ABC transporter permease [Halomonas piezotolerans]KJD18122.1 ABC transporter permease [Halomonas meridiana]MCG7576470.1 branched-chain amino acid ABC transporter permease [Halomonas sp. MMH1-48]MCG7590477.1 branched-chain amino acid ABC transporter permease [Halomonas sp. McD50-5]|tara:strand:+ start:1505 stop:2365 length:861 start_codon:yes stop_codon:yes gene_type:complete